MTKPVPLSPAELLREKFAYNPLTGELLRKNGQRAGTKRSNGYYQVGIGGRIYKQHRVIWKWIHGADPVGVVDHIDDNPDNNTAWNLQDITVRKNSSRTKSLKSGLPTGVVRVSRAKGDKYKSTAYIGNRPYHLGYYETAEEAAKVYQDFLASRGFIL